MAPSCSSLSVRSAAAWSASRCRPAACRLLSLVLFQHARYRMCWCCLCHPPPVGTRDRDRADRRRLLVAGATGFVGRRLVERLVAEGHAVRAMTRHPDRYDGPGEPVAGDVADAASLDTRSTASRSPTTSCTRWAATTSSSATPRAAEAFGRAAGEAGVSQIIYLGGLGAQDPAALSPHLRSRREVEGLLARRRPSHRPARRDHHRRWRRLMGDHPPTGEEPAGDGDAPMGAHQDPAARPQRRDPLPRRGARPSRRDRAGVRDRRARRLDVRRHAPPGGTVRNGRPVPILSVPCSRPVCRRCGSHW